MIHIRSHTTLPRFFTEGSARADQLTNTALQVPVPNTLSQAHLSHQFFHLAAKALSKQFAIPIGDAKLVVQTCPDCQQRPGPPTTVNPRGLSSLQLWQTDVTHVPQFGRLKYVHVSIDSFSHTLWASAMMGETSCHAQVHFCVAFAALGIPKEIKTDNGPAYTSRSTRLFFHSWGITHKTGIPHSPTGQAIVEHVHRTLKDLLAKQKKGETQETPQNRLNKVVYVINHLTLPFQYEDVPPIIKHFKSMESGLTSVPTRKAMVMMRNLDTGGWEGPYPLITWGRGYACVSTGQGPRWVPARGVRPWLGPSSSSASAASAPPGSQSSPDCG